MFFQKCKLTFINRPLSVYGSTAYRADEITLVQLMRRIDNIGNKAESSNYRSTRSTNKVYVESWRQCGTTSLISYPIRGQLWVSADCTK